MAWQTIRDLTPGQEFWATWAAHEVRAVVPRDRRPAVAGGVIHFDERDDAALLNALGIPSRDGDAALLRARIAELVARIGS